MRFMLNIYFFSGSLEFCYVPGRGYLHDQPPVKTLGAESLVSFPGDTISPCYGTCCWRN